MIAINSGIPFAFNYPTGAEVSNLNVLATIFDVSSGTASEIDTVVMSEADDDLGVYSGTYIGLPGKTYLVTMSVYTDDTYDDVDTGYPPAAECYQDVQSTLLFLAFNYGAFDGATDLTLQADIFDATKNTNPLATVQMTHVINGVYFGSYNGQANKTYLVTKYTDGRPPGADVFQGSQFNPYAPIISTSVGDVPDILVSALAAFIRTSISELTVLEEFPYANQQLTYPSLTISTTKPVRTPIMPYIDSTTEPDEDNQVTVNLVVAEWDDVFQLDLWCRNKLERRQYTDKLIALFNSQEVDSSIQANNNPDGLSLELTSYYNVFARFEVRDIQCVDNEAAAQRQERREKISVLVNCMEIRQRTSYGMVTIETNVGTADTDDDTDNTDEYTLPS